MSAIFGVVRFDGTEVCAREIERMGAVLAHRGPDGRRVATAGPVGMGHALMRVNREDWHEAQPIEENGVMLVADLRLDNREEVVAAAGIDPASLPDLPDSALLLAAYRLWGDDCVDHMLGDFTFAIWDSARRTLLLGRDHMGQRGLYYHSCEGFIAFASEAKALWTIDGVPRRLSQGHIHRRLLPQFNPVAGRSPFEDIKTLPGGTVLRIDAKGAAIERRYWQPHADPAHLDRDDDYYLRTYRGILSEAVACRVRRLSRRPAMLLSGGFDSGAIAVLAGPIVAAEGRTLFCVSSVLPHGETRPNTREARAAVDAFRAMPFLDVQYHVRRDDGFERLEEQFAATMNHVIPIQHQLLAVAQASGARLVMDGFGGDYTVHMRSQGTLGQMLREGDFRRFAREVLARRRATGRRWRTILRTDIIAAFMPRTYPRWRSGIRAGERPWRSFQPIAADFAVSLQAASKAPNEAPNEARNEAMSHEMGTAGIHASDRWRARWVKTQWLQMLGEPWTHTTSAAYGLDHTRPFHDPRIVELGLAIPLRLQLRDGLERYIPRRALAGLLPPALLASGPGNDEIDPDQFRHIMAALPALLARARAADDDGEVSRHVDFDAIETMIAGLDEGIRYDRDRAALAMQAITLALFVAWFDTRNAKRYGRNSDQRKRNQR